MNKDTTPKMRKETSRKEAARLEALLDHLGQLLPDDKQRRAFRACSNIPPPTALRLNPLVPQSQFLRPILTALGEQVPWCPQAFVLPESENRLGHTLEYALGAFYIQAKAPTLAVEALAPQPGERVLDMCAAPGGKATQIAARMNNAGLLIVNEPRNKRIPSLVGHLERCGVTNAITSKAPGTMLARYFHNYFDRVLVDAPCSGDGIVRKDRSLLRYWSVEDARHQGQIQKGLLRAAFHMLRPGGSLVYSTCSLSLEENEEVLLALIDKFPDQVEILPVDNFPVPSLPPEQAARFPAEFTRCVRVWPHLHDTEGAFVVKLRKSGKTEWFKKEGDANEFTTEDETNHRIAAVRAQIEEQWRFDLSCPGDHILALDHRHLSLQPQQTSAFRTHYPFFVRSGMRIGRRHKDHYYLSQQAITKWGSRMQDLKVELTWDQVKTLFRGDSIHLPERNVLKGEVLCTFGPWSLCRGIVEADGHILQSMLPREHRRPDLSKLS